MSPRRDFGLTWWGQRWIAALEALGGGYVNRLPRGRTYARQGTVSDVAIEPGMVTALVQGSRARPYDVVVEMPAFDDPTWQAISAAMVSEVRHSAELLNGQMPEDIDDVLESCGVSLFPAGQELQTYCSCPDVANPCKHVAAVHYVLAQEFDADPFLLPQLRGRDRAQLLAGLRAARSGDANGTDEDVVVHESLSLADFSARTLFQASGDLGAIRLRPNRGADPAATLRRLGPPPGALGGGAAELELEEIIVDAASFAWNILSAEAD